MTSLIPNIALNSIDSSQCFPLYAFDGKLRRDNITDWALGQFQAKYGPDVIRWDIFHYVHGLLHAPGRGPFQQFVGAALAALHVGYEQAKEYPLTQTVNKDVPFSWRVAKMRLNKEKTAVVVNEALTLAGLPPEAFEYKIGNRSALEWVLDQYQVGTDKRSGIVSDPNWADDPEYIVRLVRRVVTVSLETVRLVASLPPPAPPA